MKRLIVIFLTLLTCNVFAQENDDMYFNAKDRQKQTENVKDSYSARTINPEFVAASIRFKKPHFTYTYFTPLYKPFVIYPTYTMYYRNVFNFTYGYGYDYNNYWGYYDYRYGYFDRYSFYRGYTGWNYYPNYHFNSYPIYHNYNYVKTTHKNVVYGKRPTRGSNSTEYNYQRNRNTNVTIPRQSRSNSNGRTWDNQTNWNSTQSRSFTPSRSSTPIQHTTTPSRSSTGRTRGNN